MLYRGIVGSFGVTVNKTTMKITTEKDFTLINEKTYECMNSKITIYEQKS